MVELDSELYKLQIYVTHDWYTKVEGCLTAGGIMTWGKSADKKPIMLAAKNVSQEGTLVVAEVAKETKQGVLPHSIRIPSREVLLIL